MKKLTLILLIIVASLIASIGTFFYFEYTDILQVNSYGMDVRVTDDGITGFNIDTDALHFGSMSAGSGSQRELVINNVEEEIKVQIIKKGTMATWVTNPNNILVKKGHGYNITFHMTVPQGTPLGNYTGEVIISLRKP